MVCPRSRRCGRGRKIPTIPGPPRPQKVAAAQDSHHYDSPGCSQFQVSQVQRALQGYRILIIPGRTSPESTARASEFHHSRSPGSPERGGEGNSRQAGSHTSRTSGRSIGFSPFQVSQIPVVRQGHRIPTISGLLGPESVPMAQAYHRFKSPTSKISTLSTPKPLELERPPLEPWHPAIGMYCSETYNRCAPSGLHTLAAGTRVR